MLCGGDGRRAGPRTGFDGACTKARCQGTGAGGAVLLGPLRSRNCRSLSEPGLTTMRESNLPSISVVTPSFNQARFLSYAIDSVLSQRYPALEYGVVDGGSSDGSVEILREYDGRLSYWVSEPDGGMY